MFFRVVGIGLITIEVVGELVTGYRGPYLNPSDFHFSYILMPWLEPWPPGGVIVHFLFNIACGALVAAGAWYRWTAPLFFVGTGSLFLMEKAAYINHTYLYILIAFLMIFVPAHGAVSVDVRHHRSIARATAPAWTVGILRFQIAVVYVFAGIAKLNADWLSARPMRLWLEHRTAVPVIGPVFGLDGLAEVMSWGGALLDLLVVPALLWRPTRLPAFVAATAFHLMNVLVFGLGTFPWFSIAATALFFPPASFRRLPGLRKTLPPLPDALPSATTTESEGRIRRRTVALLAAYAAIQLLVPLRPWLYPGDPAWTEYGHRFSWRMMARTKHGWVEFHVRDPSAGAAWTIDPRDVLDPWQTSDMVGKPDMILEFAHDLADRYARAGRPGIEIRAITQVSLNGRPAQPIVDPDVDLVRQKRSLRPYPWVVPLETATPARTRR